MRIVLILMFGRVHVYDAGARPLTVRYLTGFSLGAAAWAVSTVVPVPARYGLWAVGLLIELATPLAAGRAIAKVPFHVGHIPERFGLFLIIVLGEVVALDAIGTGAHRVSPGVLAVGFLITAAIWWHWASSTWSTGGRAGTYGRGPGPPSVARFCRCAGSAAGCRSWRWRR